MDIYKDYMDVIKEAVNSDSSSYLTKGLDQPLRMRSKEQLKISF